MMPTAATCAAAQKAISRLGAGDHLCCIYRDRSEQMGIVVPYLVHGLHNNEKCLYIIDESTREDVFHAFAEVGVDLPIYLASGQFLLLTKADAYLKGGSFDPDRMIATLKQVEANAIKEGYTGLRITGEMTWILSGLPGVEGLIEYESKLNLFFPGSKSTAICQYHEARFDPDILIDVLHTHPAVVIYGEVCENPYYIPADEFLLRMKSAKIPLALYQRVRDDIIARAGLEVERQRLESALSASLDRSERTRQALLSTLEDQKQAAIKLRTLSSRQEAILAAIPDIVVEVDCHKVYSWANQVAVSFFGDDVIGKEADFYFEGEETVYRTVQPLFDGDENVIHVESWQRRKDGEKRLLLWSCRVLKDTHGNVTGALSSAHDITERKLSEAYHGMGMEVLQVLNAPGDVLGAIQRVIAVLKTRTGLDAVGLRLQEGEDFPYYAQDGLSKDFLLTENTLLERDARGGVCRDKDGNVSLECTCGLVISGKTDAASPLFTRGGSFWTNDSFPLLELPPEKDPRHHPRNQCIHQGYASVALVPIRNQERIVGLLHLNDRRKGRFSIETIELLEDIAAHIGSAMMRKRAEQEREQMQAQLVQSQKLESIGTLAGGVAHEINNPVMGIMNYAQLILDRLGPDSPVSEYATEIGKETQRVATIVKNLLSFARLDKENHKSPSRIGDIVEDTLSLIHAVLRHDQITLEVNVPADLPKILCRSQQIRQVIMNLLTNARDASNQKYPKHDANKKILITARSFAKDGRPWLRTTVEDHGPGIPEELRARIFDPFFSTKPRHKGTGLGLSISHSIVKDHGGELSVESEVGQWTRFSVDLPVESSD